MHSSSESEDTEENDSLELEELKPRAYQLELLQQAVDRNIIAFLDTGTGKTLIALLLIKEISGKSVFLAPQRILVTQQSRAASMHGIPNISAVGSTRDGWGFSDWQQALSKVKSLFMTPELFLNCLRAGYFRLTQFQLLIFDECHHCSGNSAYSKILQEFYHVSHPYRPKVLGLTASPIGHGSTSHFNLKNDLQGLCNLMDASFVPTDRDAVKAVANDPQFIVQEVMEGRETDSGIVLKLIKAVSLKSDDAVAVSELLKHSASDMIKLIGKKAFGLMLKDVVRLIEDTECINIINSLEVDDEFSNRFDTLIKVISNHLESGGGQVIVLVQKRITAWYLSECINYFTAMNNLGFTSEKLVGKMSRKVEMGLLRVSDQSQKQVVDDFKNRKFNVLVSTTVAEEGLDIPACDLVIRFDSISSNLRSYVQSKGRARDQNSKFIIFSPKGSQKEVEQTLKQFDETLKFLKELADNQLCPKGKVEPLLCFQVPSEDLVALPGYEGEAVRLGAKVCVNWSLDFIEQFCKSLNKEAYDRHKPVYISRHYRPGECTVITASHRGGYLHFLKLPKLLSLPEIHSSRLYVSDSKAKEDAALQGVRVLYERGYLNKHLKPIWAAGPTKTSIELSDPRLELVDEKGTKLKAKFEVDDSRQTTLLPQEISIYNVIGSENSEYFLYEMQVSPAYPTESAHTMGILTPIKFETADFFIYPYNIFKYRLVTLHSEKHQNCRNCRKFPFKVTPVVIGLQKYAPDELKALKLFHFIVNAICKGQYSTLLKSYRESHPDFSTSDTPVLFVPIFSHKLDLDLVTNTILFFKNDAKNAKNPTIPLSPGCLVRSTHKKEFFFYLRSISHGLDFEFEDKGFMTTVSRYFLTKYGINLQSPKVLEVRSFGNFREAIKPKIKIDKHLDPVYLPEELAEVVPIPIEVMIWCKLSPSVFYKMNQCFLTKALCLNIGIDLIHSLAIESITCGSTLETNDYQRLEILGDSVLKFLSSEYLFAKYTEEFEGILTRKRMDITSNSALFKKSMEIKLYNYLQVKVFKVKHWKPQGLERLINTDASDDSSSEFDEEYNDEVGWEKLLDELGEVRIEARYEQVHLSNKQLADCVEALIGAAFLQGGIDLSASLLRKLGIIEAFSLKCEPKESCTKKFEALEARIGYRFRQPELLNEAFTHSTLGKSYDYNRLEFLGDAIVDFIVLDYFFHKFPQAGPGSISKMKAVAVSNRTFSYISHQIHLADYLDYIGNELKSDLSKFKDNIERLKGLENITKLPETGMKVMGDLFEAFVAALYLDSRDLITVRRVVGELMASHLEKLSPDSCNLHPHNRLFDYAQRNKKKLGGVRIERFKVENRSGVEFVTKVYAQEKVVAEGRGPSKLSSSEDAAEKFFDKYRDE